VAEDHLGGAPADVDDQARQLAGLQTRHAQVDQAGFLAAGDDLDAVPQHAVRALQEGIAVAGFAQGLGGHGAHLPGGKAFETLRELRQAGQAALGGLFGQHAVAVEPAAQAHRLLEVLDALVAALAQLANLEPEAVGAHVDGSQLTIPVGTFKLPAYRAAPAGRSSLPVVLVVSEIFGVHEHIADVARRFAKMGYLAIAPELQPILAFRTTTSRRCATR
jgi:hypothetical protein